MTSVPCPSVLPRGSEYISNALSSVLELKTFWVGLGFLEDCGGIEATVTLSATRKLHGS